MIYITWKPNNIWSEFGPNFELSRKNCLEPTFLDENYQYLSKITSEFPTFHILSILSNLFASNVNIWFATKTELHMGLGPVPVRCNFFLKLQQKFKSFCYQMANIALMIYELDMHLEISLTSGKLNPTRENCLKSSKSPQIEWIRPILAFEITWTTASQNLA